MLRHLNFAGMFWQLQSDNVRWNSWRVSFPKVLLAIMALSGGGCLRVILMDIRRRIGGGMAL